MTLKNLAEIPDSPAVRTDRIARAIEKALWPAVLAGRRIHVEFQAVQLAARAKFPAKPVLAHPAIRGLAALERLG